MLNQLRAVTRFDVEIPSAITPLSKERGAAFVLPLQTLAVSVHAVLTVPIAVAPQHDGLRQLALELGESDVIEAWKRLLSCLCIVPVIVTKTGDDGCGGGYRASSVSSSTGGGGRVEDVPFVHQLYPPSTLLPGTFSYLSLSWPEDVLAGVNDNHRVSFSPPGGVLARLPGTTYSHAAATRIIEGTLTGPSLQPSFTYSFALTIPNIADGSGCIALRLSVGRNPFATIMEDTVPRDVSVGAMLIGALVYRICVSAVLSCETKSKVVSSNRSHIQLAFTNVGKKNIQIQSVDFDILSTRLGHFKDSLDTVDQSPEHRIAPKSLEDDAVSLLARSVAVVPLPVDEARPVLQPHESFCFQFILQLRPHLAHLLTDKKAAGAINDGRTSGPSASHGRVASSSVPANDKTATSPAGAGGDCAPSACSDADVQKLHEMLRDTVFVTALHVQYRSDAWEDRSAVFRAEPTATWMLT